MMILRHFLLEMHERITEKVSKLALIPVFAVLFGLIFGLAVGAVVAVFALPAFFIGSADETYRIGAGQFFFDLGLATGAATLFIAVTAPVFKWRFGASAMSALGVALFFFILFRNLGVVTDPNGLGVRLFTSAVLGIGAGIPVGLRTFHPMWKGLAETL